MNNRLNYLLKQMDIHHTDIHSVSGGDINDSYRITTRNGTEYFIKINRANQPKDIITTEAQGLMMMKEAGVIIIPEKIRWTESDEAACLVMPFYQTKQPSHNEWKYFFQQLAHMHRITHEFFGGRDNYIGRLTQTNSPRNNWVPFYKDNRLSPQLQLAKENGYFEIEDEKEWRRLFDYLPNIIPIERPALIHGDLWGGNVLATQTGVLLIDPCPYFGHREMDLGMMMLFSGIPFRQYQDVYEDIYPLATGFWDRLEIYQLYYLLVHLNIFGSTYLPGVRRIIQKFSG